LPEPLVIEFKDVVKYGKGKQIGPINLHFPAGYVTALVGSNGAGKSTVLQMMMRCILPNEGTISWFGHPPDQLSMEVRSQICYISELPCSEEDYMTGEEVKQFRSQLYPLWDQQRFQSLIEQFEVPLHEKLNRISKGERRKFEIICALAARPKLLILDEPTAGLDPFAWREMLKVLQNAMEQEELSIILSTHIVEEIKRLADYIVLVHRGNIVGRVEKDTLYGTWQRVWLKGVTGEELEQIGIKLYEEEGAMLQKVTVRESELQSLMAKLGGVQIMKQESLEIEEVLKLWIDGQQP
jgi:ABC-2 type transport system ATP-binding protein